MHHTPHSVKKAFTFYVPNGEGPFDDIIAVVEDRTQRYAQLIDPETDMPTNESVLVYEAAFLSNSMDTPRATIAAQDQLESEWRHISFTEARARQPRLITWLADKGTLVSE